ncbi:response regulator transcription factor [Mucilaginibacter terrigena]|uniref:Response regulator transcription factor n=1 Tax=Mucilaginibacter terrigena TaxID=2492395 RepID=A0A4Q5LPR9_9SPHI|nr:LytTR family DNA-binding domain-containing protein [Mucilaginibacter terrigena]RYU91404.1 response regulator transcription factor [Mucilaginibacter terrigena]
MLRCYIIDDELHAIELLTDYIDKTPGISLAGSNQDSVKGLHEILNSPPDVLFLDIDMPLLTGLDLYTMVGDKLKVVFTTAFASYAVNSYELQAADFLLKPIRYTRFLACINKLQQDFEQKALPRQGKPDHIFVQSGSKSKIIKLRFEDIIFIESMNNYLNIHVTGQQHHVVYLSLKDLLEQLPDTDFQRVHKSYIINYRKIVTIEGNRIFLEGFPAITVGAQHREEFFKKIGENLVKKK